MKRIGIAVLLLVGLALVPAPEPMRAHGLPVQSIPEANAVLETAPAQIEIFFSEALEPSFSTISVFDSDGNQVDNGDSEVDPADPTHLTVTVRSLSDGVYTVVWKVLSAVDGHITAGSFPIAVGEVDPAALAEAGQATQQFNVSTFDIIARWLIFLTGVSFLGGVAFVWLAWERAEPVAEMDAKARALWRRLGQVALIAFVLANFLSIMVQAGQTRGTELAMPWTAAFATVLFTTRFGVIVIARALGALVLAGVLQLEEGRNRWVALAISLLVLLSISLNSHGAATDDPALPVLADWLHLVGAGVWMGGLVYFLSGLWAIREQAVAERTRLLARLIPRFTLLAVPSIALLGLTGVYSYVINVGPLENLLGTLYGQTLTVKSALFLPALALGAVNFLVITGRMKRAADESEGGKPSLVRRFRQSVTGEVAFGVAIFLSVGVLTTLPQAKISLEPPALEAESEADDLLVDLRVTPGRVGVNTFTVTVTKDGRPLEDAREVSLRFTPATSDLPPTEVELENLGEGLYQIEGSYFSLADTWQVQTAVRREDAFDAFANVNMDVGVTRQTSQFPWGRVAGVLLVVLAWGYLFLWKPLDQTLGQWAGLNLAPAVLLAASGLILFNRAGVGEELLSVNPIPPNAESVATGGELYQENCLACHGETGAGDGPVGRTLRPPPADLTVHTAPGVHPDAQLYEWITNGFPGSSVMPAFREQLTDEERWHVVNYIRTLGQ